MIPPRPPEDAGEVPSFRAWDARPVAERWARYRSPAWRPIRLATRAGGGLLGGALGLVALRLVGWPLLRGLWLAGALVAMRWQGGPGVSHGSARWATRGELAARRPRRGRADLVVGRAGRRLVAIAEEEQYEHLLLVAPTGAGKTAGLIIPNLLAEPGTRSLVITDPKRELLRTTSPRLRQVYGEAGVWVLDFLDPALSQGYNPLAAVADPATADLFAQTWVANTGTSKEPFWDNAARALIAAAALHLVATAETVPPLAGLVDFLCGQPAEAIGAALAASPAPEVRRLARGFLANLAKTERLVGAVFAELPPRFAALHLPQVRRTTALHELDLAALAARPTALYLALDLAYARTLAPLTACFFQDLFRTLAEVARARRDGALPTAVLAYLDEFGTRWPTPPPSCAWPA